LIGAVVVALGGVSAHPAFAVNDSEAQQFAEELDISVADAKKRLGWQEKASALTDQAKDGPLGSRFGGVWIDNTDGGRVKLGVVKADERSNAQARRAVESAGLEEGADLVDVSRSDASIYGIVGELKSRIREANATADSELGVGVRTDENAAQLTLPADRALTSEQAAVVADARNKYGDALRLDYAKGNDEPARCSAGSDPIPPLYCDRPLRGGVRVSGTQGCTGAFLGRSQTDGTLYQFGAGHCPTDRSTWFTRFANDLSAHDIGPFHNWVYDQRGDAGIIRVANPSGWIARAWVFVTSSPDTSRDESYRITSDSGSVVGQRVCATGASRSQSDCGTVLEVGYCAGYGVCGLARASFTVNPGDSGGPVYVSNSAKGIISGRNTQTGEARYQGIRGAESLLNVNVSFDD